MSNVISFTQAPKPEAMPRGCPWTPYLDRFKQIEGAPSVNASTPPLAGNDARTATPASIPAHLVRAYRLASTADYAPDDEIGIAKFRAIESDLIDAIGTATGIDTASLSTYGEFIEQGEGLLLLGEGTPVLGIDANGQIERLEQMYRGGAA